MKITKNALFLGLIAVMVIAAVILNISQWLQGPAEEGNANTSQQSTSEQPDDEQLFACQEDSDCIIVDTNTCCNCKNGGGEKAINKKYEQYWNDSVLRRDDTSCTDTFCVALYNCSSETPVCTNNSCIIPSQTPRIE